jgi:ectoine hydroxylase-related dioxygenase (phytanoyl-CoA dioxygenase family)
VTSSNQFAREGFQIIPNFWPGPACDLIVAELNEILAGQPQSNSSKPRGGLRNVLQISPAAATFANADEVIGVVSNLLNAPAFPVRAILFDKTEGANWGVPWHQDLAIAVAEQIETPGFKPWSVKAGVVHVNPPVSVLAGMVTIRLHLDDCDADNGALRVLPGSHLQGELDAEAIAAWSANQLPVTCEIAKGGALLMRPLLLHASTAAKNPSHRRVLHVEYAAVDLPNGLKWSERL